MAPGRPPNPTATGSKRLDLAAFLLFVLLLAALTPRLRVYHRITVMDVQLEQIDPDGSARAVPVPAHIASRRYSLGPLDEAVPRLAGSLRAERVDLPGGPAPAAGTRFRWTIRYGANSPRLDQRVEIFLEGR